jgi:PPK2 family polyphosphate:nucleotide phosphotransferase
MKLQEARRIMEPFKITDGTNFRLKDIDPGDSGPKWLKAAAPELAAANVAAMGDAQEKLYAQDKWAVLLIFQAMDAAGKDGTIKHVMSGINPTGVQVFSFKQPSAEELDHDFLWRTTRCLPEKGRIGIFNRSYYEEALVVRVHPEFLTAQRLAWQVNTKKFWRKRFEDITTFERHLARNATIVLKFFLHVSKDEQKRRFLSRLDEPAKNWKFSAHDVRERERWNDYMAAYEDMIRETAAPRAPWFVVPADHKWFTHVVVGTAIVDALSELDLAFPTVDAARRKELAAARAALQRER